MSPGDSLPLASTVLRTLYPSASRSRLGKSVQVLAVTPAPTVPLGFF
jgi:hypothetical protein